MPLPNVTLEGHVFRDPELRFLPTGKAVLNLTVRCGEKKRDDGSYGDSLFIAAPLWGEDAEAGAGALHDGDAVTVTGVLYQRQYEKQDGTKGSSVELKFARASKSIRAPRGQAQQPTQPATQQAWSTPQTQPDDPWGTPPF